MRWVLFVIGLLFVAGCRDRDASCSTDADCAGFERAVCLEGNCVCEFDQLDRCFCDAQSRCDDVYGVGVRICDAGSCVACTEDADCGHLGRCGAQGECSTVECETDQDCPIGVCSPERNDCVACVAGVECPNGLVCRPDGACVECVNVAGCGVGEICDVDVQVASDVEVVGTNQCGIDCGPRCQDRCSGDPDCLLRPACVVEDPACLPAGCDDWIDCELPEECVVPLGPCPAGIACEALAASFLMPVFYACLPTPCLYDFECAEAELCYEGQCVAACDGPEDCAEGEVCLARVYFERGGCVPN